MGLTVYNTVECIYRKPELIARLCPFKYFKWNAIFFILTINGEIKEITREPQVQKAETKLQL